MSFFCRLFKNNFDYNISDKCLSQVQFFILIHIDYEFFMKCKFRDFNYVLPTSHRQSKCLNPLKFHLYKTPKSYFLLINIGFSKT